MSQETQAAKKAISQEEFEKRVEIEAQNLMYFEYKDKRRAFDESRQYVDSKFVVA
jgi:hypothetical protein